MRVKRVARFQLLEVLVAIFLIIVCAAPSLNIHISMYLEQNKIIRQNQRDHLVHLIYAVIVEKLYKNEIPLENILDHHMMSFEDKGEDSKFSIKQQLHTLSYECNYSFQVKEDKEKEKLVALLIQMNDLKNKENSKEEYHYLVYISLKNIEELPQDKAPKHHDST